VHASAPRAQSVREWRETLVVTEPAIEFTAGEDALRAMALKALRRDRGVAR